MLLALLGMGGVLVDRYSKARADAYADSHDLGPAHPSSDRNDRPGEPS